MQPQCRKVYVSVNIDVDKDGGIQPRMRTLPLVPFVKTRLLALKEEQAENRRLCGRSYIREYQEYVCINEIGDLIKPHYVTESFRKLLRANELREIRFHDLRHSCASLMRPDLLIFDDLGAERSTSFGKERVFDLVNRRLLSGKPMIVTTNIPLYTIKNSDDVDCQRIYGRVLEACLPVNFDGANLRAAKAAQNNQRAIKMLSESEPANAEKVIESPRTHQQ